MLAARVEPKNETHLNNLQRSPIFAATCARRYIRHLSWPPFTQVDGEYVARMEDVLDLYAEAPDPTRPVVCFDESPVQLIGEVRQPIPADPGQIERYDYEYRRNGTVNLFVCIDANRPWRKVKVTERRAAEDYAHCMRELVDVHYPDAACIRVVQDNLSTHSAGALYEAFTPAEARRILRRLEFHYTPKHASWLNMVEIGIGVLCGQCLDRRIDDPNSLIREIAAWEHQRNAAGARIKRMFTTEKARAKMGRAYPVTPKESYHCAEVLVGVLGEENRGNSDDDDLAIERQGPHTRIIDVARYACFVGRATATGDLPKSRNPWPASRIGCYRCAIS
jgi:hypothetical protein